MCMPIFAGFDDCVQEQVVNITNHTIDSIKFSTKTCGFSPHYFFKMQVISVAFRMDMFGFPGLEPEVLGMLEGAVISNPSSFSRKIIESYGFFGISRVRRLHLACSVEQSSWGFFGGSIGTSENSHLFH